MRLIYALLSLLGLLIATTLLATVIALPLWFVAVEARGLYALLLMAGGTSLVVRTRGSRNEKRADNK